MFSKFRRIDSVNEDTCQLSSAKGFDGEKLRVRIQKKKFDTESATSPFLPGAVSEIAGTKKSQGAHFLLFHGTCITHEVFFKAAALEDRKERRTQLQKMKVLWEKEKKNEAVASRAVGKPIEKL